MSVLLAASTVNAADARQFQAGRIIDDAIFTNSNSMGVADIQRFLESKMPNCDINGVERAGGGTSALTNRQWIEKNYGASPPYRCIYDYRENPSNGASNYGTWTNPTGSLSAAEIIYNYSRQFRINPQVLIVTLQKENSLITDNIPIPRQYQQALGFGCPDNIPDGQPKCDPKYNSFSNQVYQAARHFRGYIDQPAGWYVPYSVGQHNIAWSPTCTRAITPVYIQNSATASLYSYTPYQPNSAAIAAGYGRAPNGDDYGCAAYGNRNFYLYFTDWFGSTLTAGYQWQPVSQEYYTDASKTVRSSSDIPPGGSIHLVLKAKNTGAVTWSNKDNEFPINLATLPADQNSIFCTTGWLSCNRAARLVEPMVAPGEIGTFEFDVSNPTNATGIHRAYFTLVSEGRAWFNNPAMNFYLTPQPAIYTWSIKAQQAFTNSTMTTPKNMWYTKPGETAYLVIKAQNTGNVTWKNSGTNPINLAVVYDKTSKLCTTGWMGCNRPAKLQETSVAPGEIGTFAFPIAIPSQPDDYIEYYNLVSEGRAWFNNTGINYWIKIQPDIYTWSIKAQQAFTNSTMTTPKNMWYTKPGETAYLVIKAQNTGNVTWKKGSLHPVNLAVVGDKTSALCNQSWLSCNRPAALTEDGVEPGQVGTFAFTVTIPNRPGDYIEYYGLVAEGRAWFDSTGINYWIKIVQ